MKKLLKYLLYSVLVVLAFLLISISYLYYSADMQEPDVSYFKDNRQIEKFANYSKYGDNYLKQDTSGLWELKIQGESYERGRAQGALMHELLHFQEKVFVDKINEIIPSPSYIKFLRFFIQIFNRNLGENISEEYRKEIYGISEFCTSDYNNFGTPYERQLNYHAAHDIGHTMQDYMLVGCTSFAVWGTKSKDSSLIIGRNFDFYVGDEFAKNKLVSICSPEKGYKFVSIGWAGMIGVLSGMNEKGLSITLNASKASLPISAKTPVSILAREILQYASTIEEAYKIAQSREVFVSESFMIGSAIDGKAVIIEKSPDKIALYNTKEKEQIICTNHFQSDVFASNERNKINIKDSDSNYRYKRVGELLKNLAPLGSEEVASILRNKKGLNNEDIGLSNPMSIDQQIAHHSVIFKPVQKLIYVSTSPWQEGKYIVYDLNKIFDTLDFSHRLSSKNLSIAADSFFLKSDYKKLKEYRESLQNIRESIKNKSVLTNSNITNFIATNPNMYYTYDLIGDYYLSQEKKDLALKYWEKALAKQIPYKNERLNIQEKITNVQD